MLVKLHPAGPWRIGPDSGDRDRVDRVYHSDTLYSAVSGAMARLGFLEEWLDATARAAQPAVRFSSCFPFHGDTLYAVPPRSLWPPPPSAKIRWKGARFVPMKLIRDLLEGRAVSEENWSVDGPSECLIAQGTQGPYRVSVRSAAAIDRHGAGVAPHSSACLEFAPGAGLWFQASIADEQWNDRVLGAIRLLGDSGFGGERTRGWGHAEVSAGDDLQLTAPEGESAWWMLSLFQPGEKDAVDWNQGNYAVTTRGGRAEGSGELKKTTRMIAEGSVIVAPAAPNGAASDVAPENFPHPVYRAGFALALPIPWRAS
ncbi:MAG: type III-A CRISPR-associated RAMP protein Csm4 [Acidobacteriia bacterium]|nr:type III-A CRISPR-associated RAMP protein Csm4 [Terriglobia bacterium]